jgi:hypothetical protein
VDELGIESSALTSRQPSHPSQAGRKPAPQRLPWFDQWRGARGPALRSLVATISEVLNKHDSAAGGRQRARRADDQRRYQIAIETVVANLAHSALFNPDSRLAILTGNKTRGFNRYENDALGKPFRRLLGGLEALGLSNGAQTEPRIGAQKGPLFGDKRRRQRAPRRSWSGLRSRGERGLASSRLLDGQARFLKRQLSLPVSTMSQ